MLAHWNLEQQEEHVASNLLHTSGQCGPNIIQVMHSPTSLIPASSFDRLQYAKMEGEGLGERVMCVTSGKHEGRREGGWCLTKTLEVLLVIFCPRT